MLTLEQFDVAKAVLELRYENAYLLWDRAGFIGAEVQKNHRDSTIKEGQPGKIAFSIQENKFHLSAEIGLCSITAEQPEPGLDDFSAVCGFFVDLVSSVLEVKEYTRIGFRVIFAKKAQTREKAAEILQTIKGVHIPDRRVFNLKDEQLVVIPRIHMLLEDDDFAVRVVASHNTKHLQVSLTPDFLIEGIKPVDLQQEQIIVDVDYYTKGIVAATQFKAKTWIHDKLHLIKRDTPEFIKGA